jgi:LAS superfamily LD-carboxypeptidase LdcB
MFARELDRTVLVTSARRSRMQQAQLYARYLAGRSLLPAAPPGESLHELGYAVDIARPGVNPHSDDLLAYLGAEWKSIGGFWSSRDPVHFAAYSS